MAPDVCKKYAHTHTDNSVQGKEQKRQPYSPVSYLSHLPPAVPPRAFTLSATITESHLPMSGCFVIEAKNCLSQPSAQNRRLRTTASPRDGPPALAHMPTIKRIYYISVQWIALSDFSDVLNKIILMASPSLLFMCHHVTTNILYSLEGVKLEGPHYSLPPVWKVCLNNRLPLITVALIQGKALGGGAELTTACDFRLMTPESEIRFVHKKMGLVPGWGGAARLVQILGSSLALKLLSGATRVDPESALHMGLIETVLPSSSEADSLEAACTWLEHYTQGPAEVLQAIKRVISGGRDLPLEAALRTEKDTFGTVWGGPANMQALAQRTKHK
ncbi:hypothetical protein JRQ81_007786 [Phrynocephalus forsythii]|uniref:Ethylmalonyl-CoA decarboxylase n=1 Tax=Phrynocephalus forsythii TaxID=171643 RepID=A0A9Q0Y6J6_9SAUR|nr:hypothetical protein JRQ81_007786 [Phrynocephalus forsythii]